MSDDLRHPPRLPIDQDDTVGEPDPWAGAGTLAGSSMATFLGILKSVLGGLVEVGPGPAELDAGLGRRAGGGGG